MESLRQPCSHAGHADLASHVSPEVLQQALANTRQWLLARQEPTGYWVGELEGDTILESEYILLLAYLGEADSPAAQAAGRHLLNQQMPTGGWALFPGGPLEISGSVKAYWALKIVGYDPESEPLQRARQAILAHGGADAVNSFTRFYFALLGQISYDHCPTVPPEFVLLPQWLPMNLCRVSAWSRTMIVPLAIMSALKPLRQLPPAQGLSELFLRPPAEWQWPQCPGLPTSRSPVTLRGTFLLLDQLLKQLERWRCLPLRKWALARAERWMLERLTNSDGLGAIFPPMVWSIIALRALGYAADHPTVVDCRQKLDALGIAEGETLRLQPCKSPVWDTAIATLALSEAGVPTDSAALVAAHEWLLDKQVTQPGDWSYTVAAEPGGWYFEHANEFYPDVDDTSMVMLSLSQHFQRTPTFASSQEESFSPNNQPGDLGDERLSRTKLTSALNRAEAWIVAMQNRDGGWGAFDRDNDAQYLCHLPFADHNAMIDPSTPDLTARVLEALGKRGYRAGNPVVEPALAFLRQTQEADGSWFGRWGVNYIYGTWQVLLGLRAVGIPTTDPLVQRGARWLLSYQQQSGGWGESPASYADSQLRGQGNPTASQTAWAVLALIAAGEGEHVATQRGIQYLLDTQQADGSWEEPEFTGTGFPQVFYLKYHLYRIYFPLLALGRFNACRAAHVQTQFATADS